MTVSKESREKFLKDLVGMKMHEACALVESVELVFEVVQLNDISFMISQDIDYNRIRTKVKDDKVVEAYFG